jgi:hypothetical protein
VGRAGGAIVVPNGRLADEPVAAAVDGADVALGAAIVAECLAGGLDAGGQRRLGDEPAAPHLVEELVLGDDPVGVADEVNEDLEHLRFE